MAEVVVKNNNEYKQEIKAGSHSLLADVPKAEGGTELGPSPHELMLAALGACTSMTVKMYANRKGAHHSAYHPRSESRWRTHR